MFSGKKILIVDSKDSSFIPHITRTIRGGGGLPRILERDADQIDYPTLLKQVRVDASVVHDYSVGAVMSIIEARRQGNRIIFLIRPPTWDDEYREDPNGQLKNAGVTTIERDRTDLLEQISQTLSSLLK